MLRPFMYAPRPCNDNGAVITGHRLPTVWSFVLLATVIVLILGSLVTVFAAELPVPPFRRAGDVPYPGCNTAARYDVMREAYERRLPNPCNGAKVWVQ
jgi:hypothetical protein